MPVSLHSSLGWYLCIAGSPLAFDGQQTCPSSDPPSFSLCVLMTRPQPHPCCLIFFQRLAMPSFQEDHVCLFRLKNSPSNHLLASLPPTVCLPVISLPVTLSAVRLFKSHHIPSWGLMTRMMENTSEGHTFTLYIIFFFYKYWSLPSHPWPSSLEKRKKFSPGSQLKG